MSKGVKASLEKGGPPQQSGAVRCSKGSVAAVRRLFGQELNYGEEKQRAQSDMEREKLKSIQNHQQVLSCLHTVLFDFSGHVNCRCDIFCFHK